MKNEQPESGINAAETLVLYNYRKYLEPHIKASDMSDEEKVELLDAISLFDMSELDAVAVALGIEKYEMEA